MRKACSTSFLIYLKVLVSMFYHYPFLIGSFFVSYGLQSSVIDFNPTTNWIVF